METTAQTPTKPAFSISVGMLNTANQIRLLLMGPPGAGKTYPCCITCSKNILVADFDNSLTAIRELRPEISVLPFYDLDWVKSNLKAFNARDGFKSWLFNHAKNLDSSWLLVIDSLSSWSDAFHLQQEREPKMSKTGEEDSFHLWKMKQIYFRDCLNALQGLKCDVAVTCHEREERDEKTGMLLQKSRPLFSGSMADEMGRFFTDWFRAFTTDVKDSTGKVIGTSYQWQTRPDSRYNLKTRLSKVEKTVTAHWDNVFKAYKILYPTNAEQASQRCPEASKNKTGHEDFEPLHLAL